MPTLFGLPSPSQCPEMPGPGVLYVHFIFPLEIVVCTYIYFSELGRSIGGHGSHRSVSELRNTDFCAITRLAT